MLNMDQLDPSELVDADEIASLLIGDSSSGSTRVILFEQIAGAWRFVGQAASPTTLDPPEQDLCTGWTSAIQALERRSGHQLDDRGGVLTPQQPRGDGVDTILTVSSLGDPVRMALIDTGVSDLTIQIIEALRDTRCRVLHASAPKGRKDDGWGEALTADLRSFQPAKIILLLDGADSHAVSHALAAVRGAGDLLQPEEAIIAADQKTTEQARACFGAKTKVTPVEQSAEAGSRVAETLQQEVSTRWMKQLKREDATEVFSAALLPPVPRSAAVDLATRRLARARSGQVACVAIDEGAHLHVATPEDRYQLTLAGLDLRAGISDLQAADIREAVRWLPFAADESELTDWVLNRSVRPWTELVTERDRVIQRAMARQIVQHLSRIPHLPGKPLMAASELVVLSGEFSHWPHPGAAALTVLDGLGLVPERGVIELALDDGELMAAAGVAGLISPSSTDDVLAHDALRSLGAAVVLSGVSSGAKAADIEVARDGEPPEHRSIMGGELIALPLGSQQTATVTVKPARKVGVGTQPAGRQMTLGEEKAIAGGALGLIIDARERPLNNQETASPETIARWFQSLIGSGEPH